MWSDCAKPTKVIVAPLALIAIQRPEQIYVRYFMISAAASLLLLAAATRRYRVQALPELV
jgi:hypothetical protein